MPLGQNQKPAVVRQQVQAVLLVAKIPADPVVARGALPGRRREAQQCQPLLAPTRHVPQRATDLAERAQLMMRFHQRSEARLLGARHQIEPDLAEIHAPTTSDDTAMAPGYRRASGKSRFEATASLRLGACPRTNPPYQPQSAHHRCFSTTVQYSEIAFSACHLRTLPVERIAGTRPGLTHRRGSR